MTGVGVLSAFGVVSVVLVVVLGIGRMSELGWVV